MTLALCAAVLTSLAGCGDAGKGDGGGVAVTSVAIVAPGGARDAGWTEQGVTAVREVARAQGLRHEVVTRTSRAAVADEIGRHGNDRTLVVAHGRDYGREAVEAARAAQAPVLVFGQPGLRATGRVGDIEVAAEQGGYLAGYIAARASFIPSVGIVVASDDPLWYRTAGGFIAGARAFDPGVKISYARVGADRDQDIEASQRAARRQILGGTQMVLGLGDRSTQGVMRATRDALKARGQPKFDAFFIDVVGDKARAGHRSITGLTAIVWDFAPAYRAAIADLRRGAFGSRPYVLDLANGGVSVIANGRTPTDNYEAALGLGEQIQRGDIEVPVTSTDAAVRRLLREG